MIQKFLTNTAVFKSSRDGQSVQLFVIHKQAGNGMLYNFFQGGSRGTSTHYQVMKSGEIYQFVREEHTAYANGNWGWNVRGLSIEFEGNDIDAVTDAQYENTARLVADLSKKYNFPCEYRDANALKNYSTRGVTIHKNIVSTACPANVDYMRVINRANQLLNVTPPSMDTVVYGNENWAKEDIARIVSNLQGTPGTYDWEFEKFKKNPAQTLIDILTWRDYKNKTAEQLVAVRNELNTVKGLLNEKDTQISALNTSISNVNTQLAVCTQEKQELLIRADKIDAEFSDFKATSANDKENLEKDIAQKEESIKVLTENNARIQEELRLLKESTGAGIGTSPDPALTVLARLAQWIKGLLSKKA